ncbi:Asp23/Gls24 family envelope stress response protein [Mycolicibacterium sp.]|uniref:Asp23/Gls24 family envelope stress response protein n=1 Tax=Mycolicibacterium sp. TaxID=2320850 RepID=UPI001A30B32C|nr:Asp23/Gls24 family envelope stress response protein [Mycolicibacterium sp.]MBJ7338817.1 Asp23/Gls24 family envelope stress response protein [Mycolicibacterium sp.]
MTSTQPLSTTTVSTTGKSVAAAGDSALVSSQGKTTIADTVVSKIAGIAAREVSGVYDLGGGASRVVGALRERIPGASLNHSQGVSVEVGEKQAAVDLDIVAEYGVSIADLATGLRRNVIAAIERMTGLQVTEVNVTVHDIHLAGDDDDTNADDAVTRVQ